ncbi:CRISPR-associated endonuclease Cas1 [Bacteroidales bacterium KA00251]|nr:CRISPR-associated endonuclease Cas1 [Bacteroidales bacterium KA00251]
MFTLKELNFRTIFVINGQEGRRLRVSNGELLIEEKEETKEKYKTLTKIPFQKVIALFVIGHITVTSPLMEKCQKFGVSLIVMKPNLRPIFFWNPSTEANFLLRQRQYALAKEDLSIAQLIVANKIQNQIKTLQSTRKKDPDTQEALSLCTTLLAQIPSANSYNTLMGLEGACAKAFFSAFFKEQNWVARRPRTKCDPINAALDIGYTLLFNYMECFVRLFGFDLYVGVFHRLWFKRKSLVCDLVEPFRCLIDKTVRTAFNRGQFKAKDFEAKKGEYLLKREKSSYYYKVFMEALIPRKGDFFAYVRDYYRSFMRDKPKNQYPTFIP